MSVFTELKRRNVFRVGVAYVVTSCLLLQFADIFVCMWPTAVVRGKEFRMTGTGRN